MSDVDPFTAPVPVHVGRRRLRGWPATLGAGGAAAAHVREAEANALLDDPRAELVYAEKTISIVAPSMIQRQRKDHLDLMTMFLQPERLEAGAKFARENAELLGAVERKTKVDREVIIGILM